MTYVAGFRCLEGVILCADTLETVGDHKRYIEKLSIGDDHSYPLAIGGAGAGDLIDAAIQEITERVSEQRPSQKDLRKVLKACLKHVYEHDAPALGLSPRSQMELLVAAKPPDGDFCLYATKGKRVVPGEQEIAIVGYGTAGNYALLRRLYRPSLSLQQGVMVAVYAVTQSIRYDNSVGGEPRVAIVAGSRAVLEPQEYVKQAEERVQEFMQLTDLLFLDAIDVGIAPSVFSRKADGFGAQIVRLREKHIRLSAEQMLRSSEGWPYPRVFVGALMTVREGQVDVREDSTEEQSRIEFLRTIAERNPNNKNRAQEIHELFKDRELLFVGRAQFSYGGPAPVPPPLRS